MTVDSHPPSFESISTPQTRISGKNGNAVCLLITTNPAATPAQPPEKISTCVTHLVPAIIPAIIPAISPAISPATIPATIPPTPCHPPRRTPPLPRTGEGWPQAGEGAILPAKNRQPFRQPFRHHPRRTASFPPREGAGVRSAPSHHHPGRSNVVHYEAYYIRGTHAP